jgi:uncharacterized repeat protein (TIGR02543 family)
MPPNITTVSLPNGTVGAAYNQTLAATGDTPITWSVMSGSLPDGLSLTAGVISGTPTASGTFTFTVKAENAAGNDTKEFSITVSAGGATTYNFTRTAGTGGTVSGTASGSYTAGTAISVTATADSGYRFTGWTVNGVAIPGGNTTNPAAFAMPGNSVTLTANFAQDTPGGTTTYNFTRTAGTGGTVSGTASGSYTAGTAISVTATPDKGYHFTEWTINGASITGGDTVNPAAFSMPANAVALTANFAKDTPGATTYNFTRTAGAGGTVSGTASGSYSQGTAISVTATADSGYRFTGWTVNGASITGGYTTNPAAFSMPANAVTLTANFETKSVKTNPDIPATGDRGNPLPYVLLGISALCGLCTLVVRRKKRGHA